MSRSLGIGLMVVLTALAAGSAWGANLLVARLVSVEEQAPTPTGGGGTTLTISHGTPGVPPHPRALSEEQYIDGIMSRNIFDMAMIDAWAARNPSRDDGSGKPQRTELHLKLVATMVTEPAEYSIAAIADEATPNLPNVYGLNDVIQDRTIVSISEENHGMVGLKGPDGTIEYLMMDGGDVPSTTVASNDDSSGGTSEGVQQTGDGQYAVSRELFDKYLGDPESIAGLGRALLHRGPDGEYDGYRLSAIRRNTIADQLGIKNGDIINSVNGQPLNSVSSAMSAYTTMKSQSNFCFEITRRGQQQKLCYDVK